MPAGSQLLLLTTVSLVQKKKNHSHSFYCPAVDNGQPIPKIKEFLHFLDTAACIVVAL